MNCLSLNIRGLDGVSSKVRLLKHLIRKESIDFVALQE